jgi:hypothetical protein
VTLQIQSNSNTLPSLNGESIAKGCTKPSTPMYASTSFTERTGTSNPSGMPTEKLKVKRVNHSFWLNLAQKASSV